MLKEGKKVLSKDDYNLEQLIENDILIKPYYVSTQLPLINLVKSIEKKIKTGKSKIKYDMSDKICSIKDKIKEIPMEKTLLLNNLKKDCKYICICDNKNKVNKLKKAMSNYLNKDVVFIKIIDEFNQKKFKNFYSKNGTKIIITNNSDIYFDNLDGIILNKTFDSYESFNTYIRNLLPLKSNLTNIPTIIDLGNNTNYIKEINKNLKFNNTIDMDKSYLNLYNELSVFEDSISKLTWDKSYEKLKEFYSKYNHCDVPSGYKTEDGYSLGRWCRTQKQNFDEMSEKHKQKLIDINFDSEQYGIKLWSIGYNYLLQYYNEFGNVNIKRKYETKDGYNLGLWCSTQKTNYKNGNLEDDRIVKLKKLNFNFNSLVYLSWDESYIKLNEYYNEFNNSNVDISYQTKDGYKLGKWCYVQIRKFNNDNLETYKIEKLKKLNFDFNNTKSFSWDDAYLKLVEFYQKFGYINVPIDYITEDGYNLGIWYRNQIKNYKINNLNEKQFKKLNLLNFIPLNKNDINWNNNYNTICDYYLNDELNNLYIRKKNFSKEEFQLYCWCAKQKHDYKTNKLSYDRYDKLSKIGFNFYLKKENRNKIISLFNHNANFYLKYKDIFETIPYDILVLKLKYLIENNIPIETNNQLNELLLMTDFKIKEKYGINFIELNYNNKVNIKRKIKE